MATIYVVAKFEEAALAHQVMEILEAEGHRITHDWTSETLAGTRGIDRQAMLQDIAIEDIEGVQNAEAVVVLYHPKLNNGRFEIGAALGLDKPVIVVGGVLDDETAMFWHPCVTQVPHIDGALTLLKMLFPVETADQCATTPAVQETAFAGYPEPGSQEATACQCPICEPQTGVFILDFSRPGVC